MHPVRKAPWAVSIREQKKAVYNALLYKKYPVLYRKKIQPSPPWNYYLMIVAFFAGISGLILELDLLAAAGFGLWLLLISGFIIKRLWKTSRSFDHVTEMIITSIFIPFVSVYWQLRGAWRYRVLFI